MNLTDPTGRIQERSAAQAADQNYRNRERAIIAEGERQAGEAVGNGILDGLPVIGDVRGIVDFIREPSALGGVAVLAGVVPGIGDAASGTIRSLQRSVRTLERRAAQHEARAAAFRENPTVRPGMEGQSTERIAAQQEARAQHLEGEAVEFRRQADAARAEIERLRDPQ